MDHPLVRAAALVAVALLFSGCGTDTPDASALTGPAAEQTAKDADPATAGNSLAGNLDDQIRQAQLLRAKGDFDGASRALGQLMLVAPDDPRVVGEYGKVLAQRGRSADAAAFLNRAVQLQPDDWSLYSALGVVDDQLGDHNKARADYGNALRLNPGEASVLNNFALSRMLAGDLQMAASLSAEAVSRDGTNPKIIANQEMIAGMLKSRGDDMPAPASPQGAQSAPFQPVAVQRLPSTTASAAPKPLSPVASTARTGSPRVIMEKVPFDPYAGPVKEAAGAPRQAKHAPHKLAHEDAAAPKKQAAQDPVPSLRTAAD